MVKEWMLTQYEFLRAVREYVELVLLRDMDDLTVGELFECMEMCAKGMEEMASEGTEQD